MACQCCGNVCCCVGSLAEEGREPENGDPYVFTERDFEPRFSGPSFNQCAHPAEPPAGESSSASPCSTAQLIVEWCGITLALPALDPAPATPYPLDQTFPFAVPSCSGNTVSNLVCIENERNQPPFGIVRDSFNLSFIPYFAPNGSVFENVSSSVCGNRCLVNGVVFFGSNNGINALYRGRTGFFRRDGCDADVIVGGQLLETQEDGAGAPCVGERPIITVTFAP